MEYGNNGGRFEKIKKVMMPGDDIELFSNSKSVDFTGSTLRNYCTIINNIAKGGIKFTFRLYTIWGQMKIQIKHKRNGEIIKIENITCPQHQDGIILYANMINLEINDVIEVNASSNPGSNPTPKASMLVGSRVSYSIMDI